MRMSLIDISEKIDKRRLDAIEKIAEITGSLKIPFFVMKFQDELKIFSLL